MGEIWENSHIQGMHLCFCAASSRAGQPLRGHRHSSVGAGHLCRVGQAARGKAGGRACRLSPARSHSRVHRPLYLAARKQLLPLARVFTQTQTVGGYRLVRTRKAKSRTGLWSLKNTYIIIMGWDYPCGNHTGEAPPPDMEKDELLLFLICFSCPIARPSQDNCDLD